MEADEKINKAKRAATQSGGGGGAHSGLTGVTADQHHAESHSHAHSELTGVTANQQHTPPSVPTAPKAETITTNGQGNVAVDWTATPYSNP